MRKLLLTLTLLASGVTAAQAQGTPTAIGVGPHGKKLYQLMVFSNPTPGKEDEFNRWYDRIHAPVMIESGDFISAQRFAYSPVQLGGGELPKRSYLVVFTIETDDIARVSADTLWRLKQPRNISSDALDYKSLLSATYVAVGPLITQKEAQLVLAKEQAEGRIPAATPREAAP
jgi:hypothetical protein